MRFMVSGATASMERFAQNPLFADYLGVLATPNTGNNLQRVTSWDLPWCVDNAAFKAEQFSTKRYLGLLDKAAQTTKPPLFVTVPDQVGNHDCTRFLFDRWLRLLETFRLPLAFVAQDGIQDVNDLPWDRIDALFIGGSTEFKDDVFTTCDLIPEAKRRKKWVHMGRVNGRQRLRLALHSGCDSVDGTSLSWFADTCIPQFVQHASDLEFEAVKLRVLARRLERQLADEQVVF